MLTQIATTLTLWRPTSGSGSTHAEEKFVVVCALINEETSVSSAVCGGGLKTRRCAALLNI